MAVLLTRKAPVLGRLPLVEEWGEVGWCGEWLSDWRDPTRRVKGVLDAVVSRIFRGKTVDEVFRVVERPRWDDTVVALPPRAFLRIPLLLLCDGQRVPLGALPSGAVVVFGVRLCSGELGGAAGSGNGLL